MIIGQLSTSIDIVEETNPLKVLLEDQVSKFFLISSNILRMDLNLKTVLNEVPNLKNLKV